MGVVGFASPLVGSAPPARTIGPAVDSIRPVGPAPGRLAGELARSLRTSAGGDLAPALPAGAMLRRCCQSCASGDHDDDGELHRCCSSCASEDREESGDDGCSCGSTETSAGRAEVVHRTCAGCAHGDQEDESECSCVRRAGTSTASAAACADCTAGPATDGKRRASTAISDRITALRGGGAPLEPPTRAFFEPRLGMDLGAVRIHTGATPADLAGRLDARAFTTGPDVFFGANEYRPRSDEGMRLLAHELTHVVQQPATGARPVRRLTISDPGDQDELEADRVADELMAGRVAGVAPGSEAGTLRGNWLDDVADTLVEGAEAVGETVVEGAEAVGEAVVEGAEAVAEAVAAGADWVLTTAGEAALSAAQALAAQFGGRVSVGPDGLVIDLPSVPFCPTVTMMVPLPGVDYFVPLIVGGFSAGVLTVIGSVGLNFAATPSLTAVLGPCTLSGVRIKLDPRTDRYSAAGTISISAALSQLTTARAGLRGQVDAIVVAPVGGVPVPIRLAGAAIEGGGQLALRLTGGGTLAVAVQLSYLDGQLTLGAIPALALGGAIDLDLGVYARLDVLDKKLCELVWPLWHWDADIARQWNLPLVFGPDGLMDGTVGAIVSEPVPFDEAVRGVDRSAPATDCPVLDQICVVLRALGLLPSQVGVGWKGHPSPRTPTPCNTHPDAPYVANPLIPSGGKCRGTCGVDCAQNCVPEPDRTRCADDPSTGTHLICVYRGVLTCGTHQGCRDHDACFDYCAENDHTSIFDTCHRWCDFGCICEYDAATCIGWALGYPPFDATMTYYDESTSITHGPFPGRCPPTEVMLDRVQRYLDLVDPVEIVTALAEAPLEERRHLAADPVAVELLEFAITPALWPVARRILDGAPSLAVPSLDEATAFLAERLIRAGDRGRALDVVLTSLRQRGVVIRLLADWSYFDRVDRGEGLTTFDLHDDPATPGRRRAFAPVMIEIYTPAFTDVGWLFSTVMHEYLHALQVIAGYDAAEFDAAGDQRPEYVARDEVESYLWEIEHAVGTGLINNPAQMRELGTRLDDHFADLTDALRDRYRDRHAAAHARIDAVVAGRPPLSIEEARRIVAESGAEIAELLRRRPTDPSVDARIEEIRRRRAEALITVALVDNPGIQVVRPGEPGTYRVPTTDAEGRVRYLHGGVHVAWHLGAASTSAYTLGEALGAGGQMAVAGTAVQGRVHPFPPDIDFDEHIHVVAKTEQEAGHLAAERIVASIRRIGGGRVPGRSDLEFVLLVTYPPNGKKCTIRQGDVLNNTAVAKLGPAIEDLDGANMNTFWRGHLADGRFTDVTRVIFVSAARPDGSVIWQTGGSAEFNLAYLEDPTSVPRTSLAKFAWAMCCDAVARADKRSWLKAAKRAYNYFSTIGDTAHMAALETVFGRPEANVEQYAVVLDGIARTLSRGPATRILTVEQARKQVEAVADMVATRLPNSGQGDAPVVIAGRLQVDAQRFTARNRFGHVARDRDLAELLLRHAEAIRVHISANLRGQVEPIIEGVVRPVCPEKDACERQR